MERVIKTTPQFRDHFEGAFWTPKMVLRNEVITIDHILPCFMLLTVGLFLATIAIVPELLLGKSKLMRSTKPTTNNCKIDSKNISNVISREKALEPYKVTKPEMESSKEKEKTIAKDKGDHQTIKVMAEIHEALANEQYSMVSIHDETPSPVITAKLDIKEKIIPRESDVDNGNTSVVWEKTLLNENLSREGSTVGRSHWSEIIEVLDKESYTTESFLDEAIFSTPQTPITSPGFDISNCIDSESRGHSHATISSAQLSEIIMVLDNEIQQEAVTEPAGSNDAQQSEE